MSDINKMFELAKTAMEKAYAPYSHFKVGCCIKTTSGKYFSGCNVENASYSLASCAEASAISTMVSSGETEIAEILVIGLSKDLCTPCGSCRQRIIEFAETTIPVHVCGAEGLRKTFTLGELLPHAFSKRNLANCRVD